MMVWYWKKSRIWFDMKYFTWYNPFKREKKRIISLLSSIICHIFFLSLQLLRIRYRVSLFSQKPKISKMYSKRSFKRNNTIPLLLFFFCLSSIVIRRILLAEILFYCSKLRIEMALIYYTANFYTMKTTGTGNCGVPARKTCNIYGKGL